MSKEREYLWVELESGALAIVTVQVLEPPLPTPNERAVKRAPTASELDEVARRMAERKYRFHPPSIL